jgi:hypothetical protein
MLHFHFILIIIGTTIVLTVCLCGCDCATYQPVAVVQILMHQLFFTGLWCLSKHHNHFAIWAQIRNPRKDSVSVKVSVSVKDKMNRTER